MSTAADYVWGTRLLYAAVVINTTLKAGTVSYSTGLPIVSHWDDLIARQVSEMTGRTKPFGKPDSSGKH